MSPNPLRNLPSVQDLLESPTLKALIDRVSRSTVVSTVGAVLHEIRREVQTAAAEKTLPNVSDLAERIAQRIAENQSLLLRPVINATGVVLSAEWGHAPLADDAVLEMSLVARDYVCLNRESSCDTPSGRTKRPFTAVENLLSELTGAEAAMVVGSKAGAAMLALAALAAGREVVVARNHLIEGDDGCRLSELIAAAGAKLCAVGAANNVRTDDYAQAISEATAALVVAQPSNCAVAGNRGSVGLTDLVEVAGRRKLPVVHDVGLGGLLDAGEFGFRGEPVVGESVKAGADVVLFAGDGLLGGPQCGILVGRKTCIEKMERHPLAGAIGVDRPTLAALIATLRLYRDPEQARRAVPLLQMLTTSVENLKNRAERLAPQAAAMPAVATAEAVAGESRLINQELPDRRLPTWCIAIQPKTGNAEQLAAALLAGTPSIVARIEQDRVLLDLRTVPPRQDIPLIAALEALTV